MTYRIAGGLALAAAALAACGGNANEGSTVTTGQSFLDAMMGEQGNDPFIVPTPATPKYRPGTVFRVVESGGVQRRQLSGNIFDVCDREELETDILSIERAPGFSGKKGHDQSGLNIAGAIGVFGGSAVAAKSDYTVIEATEIFDIEMQSAKLEQLIATDDAFAECFARMTDRTDAYMVQRGLALGSGTIQFVKDGDLGIEADAADIELIEARAPGTNGADDAGRDALGASFGGGGITINYDNNGVFVFESDPSDPASLIMIGYKDVLRADGGALALGSASGSDALSLMAIGE